MNNAALDHYADTAISLLKELIALPSFSREEAATADRIAAFLQAQGAVVERIGNNVIARAEGATADKPVLLLNSHHDTVRPNAGWTRDPFLPTVEGDRLYGLGSNDAGGPLVALLAVFLAYRQRNELPFVPLFVASAEEEVSGKGGIEAVLPALGRVDMAIVGEPTGMDMAVAEKGLLVLDCTVHGTAGHAARGCGDNAIHRALPVLKWFRDHRFERVSPTLGPIHMNVTVIHAGEAHNQVPDQCRFTVDVRCTDAYTLEEVLATIRANVDATVEPRSVRLRPSGIAADHPLVRAGAAIGLKPYGSPTLSDQALMPFPSIKLGPGRSERSHTADEFIHLSEVRDAVHRYAALLAQLRP